MEIGEIIKTRRAELGLTLEDIAKSVGVAKSTVKKWETGYISNMGRDKIAALAKILQMSPADFILAADPTPVSTSKAKLINIINRMTDQEADALLFLLEARLKK